MKKLIIIAIILMSTSVMAQDYKKWDLTDVSLGTAYFLLHTVDMMQTIEISNHPDKYYERNPILGDHPDTDEVIMFGVTNLVFQSVVVLILPHKYRKYYLGAGIIVKGGCVYNNASIGLNPF